MANRLMILSGTEIGLKAAQSKTGEGLPSGPVECWADANTPLQSWSAIVTYVTAGHWLVEPRPFGAARLVLIVQARLLLVAEGDCNIDGTIVGQYVCKREPEVSVSSCCQTT